MESLIVGVFLLKSKESRVASRVAPSEDVSCRVFLCLLSHTHPFATLGFRHVYVCVHLCVCLCLCAFALRMREKRCSISAVTDIMETEKLIPKLYHENALGEWLLLCSLM